ncbi:MAG: GNAT family N-acetyltransferase [Clostridia bacterium]|nr:GNAT family N-acetyltransferase [Clostridia bacterium]
MLEFKPITLEDAQVLRPFVTSPARFSCESSTANLVVWAKMYDNKYAIKDGMLFIKSAGAEKETYRLPFGGNLQKGIQILKDYTKTEYPPLWVQQGERFLDFKVNFGEFYEFIPQRDAFDYVYLQEDLANLSGKKYHSKRNHISAFSKKYNWEYRKITRDNLPDIFECMKKWYSEKTDRFDDTMSTEKQGIELILNNMESLNIKGGAIYIDGKVVAFTLGSPINKDVFDVHIEKALAEYATAYTVINNEFAKTLSDYKYINREDDLGLEGLRKAKLSYKPHLLLKKYLCISKKEWIKNIYHRAFSEEDNTFEDKLFDTCFKYIRTLEKEDRTVAMCFALPCKIGEKQAKYIFAVTTAYEFRGKGCATELIEKIKAEDDSILILRPVNEGLIPFYEKMGFSTFTATNEPNGFALTPLEEYAQLANENKEENGTFTAMYYSKETENLENLYFPYSMP